MTTVYDLSLDELTGGLGAWGILPTRRAWELRG
jgi:hypothetical protein